MSEEPRETFFGQTVSEWLRDVVGELGIDAVWLKVIIGAGRRDFQLEGAELDAFVRRALLTVLRAGARPVHGASPPWYWRLTEGYEGTPEEIAEKIITVWKRNGRRDPDVEHIWFALPRRYEPRNLRRGAPAASDEPRERYYGQTVSEWLEAVLEVLKRHAITLDDIIPVGRHEFGLEGAALMAFVRRALLTLLRAGARPVCRDRMRHWHLWEGYQGMPEEATAKIVAAWEREGWADSAMRDIGFLLPGAKYEKIHE